MYKRYKLCCILWPIGGDLLLFGQLYIPPLVEQKYLPCTTVSFYQSTTVCTYMY